MEWSPRDKARAGRANGDVHRQLPTKWLRVSACQTFSAELQGFQVPFVPSQAFQGCTVPNHNHVFPLMPISPMVPIHKHTHFLWGELRLLRDFRKRMKHVWKMKHKTSMAFTQQVCINFLFWLEYWELGSVQCKGINSDPLHIMKSLAYILMPVPEILWEAPLCTPGLQGVLLSFTKLLWGKKIGKFSGIRDSITGAGLNEC